MHILVSMARAKKAVPSAHGEKKTQYQFMLTPSASEMLDQLAEAAGITRSECMERLIRTADFLKIKEFDIKEIEGS